MAILTRADELYYGGAAGGGKTDLGLGMCIELHQNSIFFRREYAQLTGAKGAIERSHEILNPLYQDGKARYNGTEHMWRLPNNRRFEFGGVAHEKTKQVYKGRAHDLKIFDELPDFTESQYRFLIGWARTTDPKQRVRTVGLGNPPTTPEGEWVKLRWAAWLNPDHPDPALPGELRWYAVIDDKDVEVEDGTPIPAEPEDIIPKSRTFIPAMLADNIFLERTDYRSQLMAMPEPLRSQLLYGDFQITALDDPWQTIPTDWVREAQARGRDAKRPDFPMRGMGVDVARGGVDRTAIGRLFANYLELTTFPGSQTKDGPSAAAKVIDLYKPPFFPAKGCAIGVDNIGVGTSVVDTLRGLGMPVVDVDFRESTKMMDKSGTLKMVNVRAAAYWMTRELLDPNNGYNISLPDRDDLRVELTAPRYKLTQRGIQIEAKEDVADRLGRSPDLADAVVITLYTAYVYGKTGPRMA